MSALKAEEDPAEELPPIVGARDPLESPALRDSTRGCAWGSQVFESEMSLQVEVFKQDEKRDHCEHELLASSPSRSTILWMQEEVHVNEPENEPVMEAVLE